MLIHTHLPPPPLSWKIRKHPLSARRGFTVSVRSSNKFEMLYQIFQKLNHRKLTRQILNTYICVRICTQTKILPPGNLSTDNCTKEILSLFRKSSICSSSMLDVSTETKTVSCKPKTKTNLNKKHRTVVGQRARGLVNVWLDIRALNWLWVHKCSWY